MSGELKDESVDMAARLERKDATAVEALYDRYGRLAFALAFRILNARNAAEEAVQEAFLDLWRNPRSFDASRGRIRHWLLPTVHHPATDRPRGSSKSPLEAPLHTA